MALTLALSCLRLCPLLTLGLLISAPYMAPYISPYIRPIWTPYMRHMQAPIYKAPDKTPYIDTLYKT